MTATAVPAASEAPRRVQYRWKLAPTPDSDVVARLEAELHLPRAVCRLLAIRGIVDPEKAKLYLRPRLDHLHPPDTLLDLDRSVERLARAIRGGETILVHGDYDVDGMCSTTLATKAIRALGGKVVPFIPRRLTDGYDLSAAGVGAALANGATLREGLHRLVNRLSPSASPRLRVNQSALARPRNRP